MRFLTIAMLLVGCKSAEIAGDCSQNQTCDLRAGGLCAPAPSGRSWCSYFEPNCPGSERKWSPYAGEGLADQCLPDTRSDAGPGPDSATDAATTPDALTGEVTINVIRDSCPVPGAPVVFQHADGTPYASFTSSEMGTVVANVAPGDMVTVATVHNNDYRMTTVFELRPGDMLRVGEESSQRDECPNGTRFYENIEWPSPLPGSTAFSLAAGGSSEIGYDPQSFSLTLDGRSVDDTGKANLVAFTYDEEFNPIGASAVKSLDLNSTAVLPPWAPPTTLSFTYQNVPPSANRIDLRIVPVVNGVGVYTWLAVPVIPSQLQPDSIRYHVVLTHSGYPHGIYSYYASYIFGGNTSPVVDLSGVLPIISNLTLDASSVTRPELSWTTNGSAFYDGAVASVEWSTPSGFRIWRFVVPPEYRSLRAPALTQVFDAWAPDGDHPLTQYVVDMAESQQVDGYEEFKRGYYRSAHGLEDSATGQAVNTTLLFVRRTIRVESMPP